MRKIRSRRGKGEGAARRRSPKTSRNERLPHGTRVSMRRKLSQAPPGPRLQLANLARFKSTNIIDSSMAIEAAQEGNLERLMEEVPEV